MLNSNKRALGYRDVIFNIRTGEFYEYVDGDNYKVLPIQTETPSGGTADRPSNPEVGDLFWDTDLESLVIWNGSEWEPVGSGSAASVPSGNSASRPGDAEQGDLYFDTTIDTLLVYNDGSWVPAAPDDVAVLTELVLQDTSTGSEVVISVRNGAIIVTDPFTESVSEIDLGGTTPDPGTITNLFLNGSGQYTSNAVSSANGNGLVTLEYINTPGQFFVISDVGGPGFGYGDRQCFGLVRETIYDRTDLSGGPGVFDGGSSGGWSLAPFWYYTGSSPNSYPYIWTTYATTSQTPGGSGNGPTGVFGGQSNHKLWWDLCEKAGVGQSLRVGIANGTVTQQDGADFGNRLVMQLLVTTEMVAHPDFSNMPSAVQTNGAGWYTCYATSGDYENMGSFSNGSDKGYRFRWSTFGNTGLNQLPFITGVSNNDQITSASGQSHYVVYGVDAADKTAANSVLASAVTGPNNRLHPQGTTVDVLQFDQPYDFPGTDAADVFDLRYTAVSAVTASPLFVTYPITTAEELIEAGTSVAPIQRLHQDVCDEIRNAVTAYYLVRDLDATDTGLVNTKLGSAITAALGGQLINTFDAITATSTDDSAPEGSTGEILFPAVLKATILAQLSLYMNKFPDN
jgi:hypothetical protein